MTFKEWQRQVKRLDETMFPKIVCNDGFKVSVQGSHFHYSTPRETCPAHWYSSMELGFPNRPDKTIMQYAESPYDLTGTVYGYVPVTIINEMVEYHGGIVEEMEE